MSQIGSKVAIFAWSLLIGLVVSGSTFAADNGSEVRVPPLVDHHIHIFSPDSSAVLDSICQALGPTGCPSQVSHASSTQRESSRASNAYFFDSPDLAVPVADAAEKVRAENAFVIAQAHASSGRLVPFISVNPRAAGALDEIG